MGHVWNFSVFGSNRTIVLGLTVGVCLSDKLRTNLTRGAGTIVRSRARAHCTSQLAGHDTRQNTGPRCGDRNYARYGRRMIPVAIPIVLGDTRIDISIADVDVACRIPPDIGRLPEQSVNVGKRQSDMSPRPEGSFDVARTARREPI
jgi:hypothetical protein